MVIIPHIGRTRFFRDIPGVISAKRTILFEDRVFNIPTFEPHTRLVENAAEILTNNYKLYSDLFDNVEMPLRESYQRYLDKCKKTHSQELFDEFKEKWLVKHGYSKDYIEERKKKIKRFYEYDGKVALRPTEISRFSSEDDDLFATNTFAGLNDLKKNWLNYDNGVSWMKKINLERILKGEEPAYKDRERIYSLLGRNHLESVLDETKKIDYQKYERMSDEVYDLLEKKYQSLNEYPIIIINRSEMIQKNKRYGYKEVVIHTGIYLGTIKLLTEPSGKIDLNSVIFINHSHFVTIYKPLEDNNYYNLENYNSFDSNISHSYEERRIRNDEDSRERRFDPDPRYYNSEHQRRATDGDEDSFLYKLYNTDATKGLVYTLRDLYDEDTVLGRMTVEINQLLQMFTSENVDVDENEAALTPDSLVMNLYTLFAEIKYDVDRNSFSTAAIIFDTDKGWNIGELRLGSKFIYKDKKLQQALIQQLTKDIQNRYTHFFKNLMAPGYHYSLYMYFGPFNNKIKVTFRNLSKKDSTGSTHMSIDEITQEIDMARGSLKTKTSDNE